MVEREAKEDRSRIYKTEGDERHRFALCIIFYLEDARKIKKM